MRTKDLYKIFCPKHIINNSFNRIGLLKIQYEILYNTSTCNKIAVP